MSLNGYKYRRLEAGEMFFFSLKSGSISLFLYTKDFQIIRTALEELATSEWLDTENKPFLAENLKPCNYMTL